MPSKLWFFQRGSISARSYTAIDQETKVEIQDKPAAKIKDTSYKGTTRIEFAFEDFHNIAPEMADYDYTDYNFEISVPDWVSFHFANVSFGPNKSEPNNR